MVKKNVCAEPSEKSGAQKTMAKIGLFFFVPTKYSGVFWFFPFFLFVFRAKSCTTNNHRTGGLSDISF